MSDPFLEMIVRNARDARAMARKLGALPSLAEMASGYRGKSDGMMQAAALYKIQQGTYNMTVTRRRITSAGPTETMPPPSPATTAERHDAEAAMDDIPF